MLLLKVGGLNRKTLKIKGTQSVFYPIITNHSFLNTTSMPLEVRTKVNFQGPRQSVIIGAIARRNDGQVGNGRRSTS